MRIFLLLAAVFSFTSCWTKVTPVKNEKVMGSIPIYGSFASAKQIAYSNTPLPVSVPGNIYVKGNVIYQLEIGRGIHVIDNSVPVQAKRVGFIHVKGSSQISIKGNLLYTNSYDDLVVVDISNSNSVTEIKRVKRAFPEGSYKYYHAQPVESGYYQCPNYDSVVIGWRKDYVMTGGSCFKN